MKRLTVTAQAVVLDLDGPVNIRPMADLYDEVVKGEAPAYLVSAFPDEDGMNRLHFSVLARNLAPVLFP